MKEANVWHRIESQLRGQERLAVERMEPVYPPGLSDCFWTDKQGHDDGDGYHVPVSGWLELKHCRTDDKVYRAGKIPKLRPNQPLFLRRQASNGVPCGILLMVEDVVSREEVWLVWRAMPDRRWVELINGKESEFAPIAHPDMKMIGRDAFHIQKVITYLINQTG